jgi:Zn-dependent protease with chaperone function
LKPKLGPFDRPSRQSATISWHYSPIINLYSGRCINISAISAATKPADAAGQNTRQLRWKILARVVYYLRIPFIVLSVYGIGYQQGIMDYSREPETMQSRLLDTTLASVGCTSSEDKEQILIAHEGEWRNLLSKLRSDLKLRHAQDDASYDRKHRQMVMMHNSSIVGEKIVKVARNYVKIQLLAAVKEATSQMPPEVLEDEILLYQLLERDDEVNLWTKARRHMEGHWQFVLIPSEEPNAFVSEILPRRIFVTTSLFETFIESQDELALVLGHEISHLILGHSSARNSLETSLRTLEILMLSLDPTEGLLSLAIMGGLASLRSAIGALYSRDNERCADELGIRLTAMACYDTRAASHVFYKMHQYNVESGRDAGLGGFFDSHPPSKERYLALLKESDEENPAKYEETSCASLKTIFFDAIKSNDEG